MRARGKVEVRQRVEQLLSTMDAIFCNPVRLEVWKGVRGPKETRELRLLESAVPVVPIDDRVWQESMALAQKAAAAGLTVPTMDLLIVACGHRHSLEIEHNDAHFDALLKLV